MKQLFFLIFTVFTAAIGQNPKNILYKNSIVSVEQNQTEIVYSFKVIAVPNDKWCYDIYKNNKIFIHQTTIPGLSGDEGFKSKSDAKKVAQLVIVKLNNGVMPPTVTKNELELLKVL